MSKIDAKLIKAPPDHYIHYGDGVEVLTTAFDLKDVEGNTLKVGDKVAAAVLSYKSAHLRIVTIKSFWEFPAIMYHKDDYYTKKNPMPTNGVSYELRFSDGKFTRDANGVAKVA